MNNLRVLLAALIALLNSNACGFEGRNLFHEGKWFHDVKISRAVSGDVVAFSSREAPETKIRVASLPRHLQERAQEEITEAKRWTALPQSEKKLDVAEWMRRATKKHPDLSVPLSGFNRAFVDEVNKCKGDDAATMKYPDWPMRLADRVAKSLSNAAKIRINSLSVKRVEIAGLFGRKQVYRYFFSATNVGTEHFTGSLKVALVNAEGDRGASEEFKINLPPGLRSVGYVEAYTAPSPNHGAYSIERFTYSLKSLAGTETGSGDISGQYEDIANLP